MKEIDPLRAKTHRYLTEKKKKNLKITNMFKSNSMWIIFEKIIKNS